MNARFSGEPEAPVVDPRIAAQAHYFAQYEHLAQTAQLYAGTELCHTVSATAMLFLIAADAEENDPVPSVVRDCACVGCRLYRLVADKSVPAMESC